MLVTKLVIRVLDAAGQMLGWVEAVGKAYGDGAIRIDSPAVVQIEQAGVPSACSIHWCDVNIEVRSALLNYPRFDVGQLLSIDWSGAPALVVGPAAGGLPPVTVRSPISIDVAAGSLGAQSIH